MFFKRKLLFILLLPLLLLVSIGGYFIFHSQQTKSVDELEPEQAAVANLFDESNLLLEPITILLLGLDNRKGDPVSRCDAIHLVTFSPPEEKIVITSVPRNAWIDLPEVASESAYLANICEQRGVEAGITEIKRISGLSPDYIIKVNFSQTLGILRVLDMPTTPTLQFLRDRTSYKRGGYQRSYNQALFLKDMVLDHTQKVAALPKTVKKIIFKMADTGDLDFETASSILNWVVKNEFWQKPEKIELVIKPQPWYKTIDVHFSETDYPSKESWQDNEDFQEYQLDLKEYLQGLIDKGNKYLDADQTSAAYQLVKTPFAQQLWLQIEDDQLRNQLHFDFLRLYILSSKDKEEVSGLVADFAAEMETAGAEDLKKQAEELLSPEL